MLMVQLVVVWTSPMNSIKTILEVFTANSFYSHKLTMKSLLLDGDQLLKVKNIGLLEIHGVHIGENGDSSESRCTATILELKLTVIGVFQKSFQFLKDLKMKSLCEIGIMTINILIELYMMNNHILT